MTEIDIPKPIQRDWQEFIANYDIDELTLVDSIVKDLRRDESNSDHYNFDIIPLRGPDVSIALDSLTISGKRFINLAAYEFIVDQCTTMFVYGHHLKNRYEVNSFSLPLKTYSSLYLQAKINRERNVVQYTESILGNEWSVYIPYCERPCYQI